MADSKKLNFLGMVATLGVIGTVALLVEIFKLLNFPLDQLSLLLEAQSILYQLII